MNGCHPRPVNWYPIQEAKGRQAVQAARNGGDADGANVLIEQEVRDLHANGVHRVGADVGPAQGDGLRRNAARLDTILLVQDQLEAGASAPRSRVGQ